MGIDWVPSSVFYQIFPDRFDNGDPANDPSNKAAWDSAPLRDNHFGGDLRGILNRLPYLEYLGINSLYLTPIFAAGSNHKYDTWDYLSVDPCFGDNALFRELVEQAHSRGIRIILDAVFNHCGDGFWAFRDLAEKGPGSTYNDWFFHSGEPVQKDPANYQTCGGAAFLPKLNTDNPEVREYLLQVARYWIQECGMDGWRLDVPWKVPMDFWRSFRKTVKQTQPDAYIVAEVWRDALPWLHGDTVDGIMNYPLRNFILDFCVFDTMDAEDFHHYTSRLWDEYGSTAHVHLNLLGSHDTPRLLTLCKNDVDRLKLAITAQFTLPGVPMLYYGDEIGMPGENDPDCRRCMRWDESTWDRQILQAYRELIRLHRTHPAFWSQPVEPLLVFNGVYAFRRRVEKADAIVVLNPRQERINLRIPITTGISTFGRYCELFTGVPYSITDGQLVIDRLPGKTAMVLLPGGNNEQS